MRQKPQEVLGKSTNVQAVTTDIISKRDNVRVTLQLFMAEVPKGYRDIESVRTILRVRAEKVDGAGRILSSEDR